MADKTYSVNYLSPLFWSMILNIYCTVFEPTQQYCYNNVFADLELEGGNPSIDSAYGVVDWFTWSGWIEAYLFHCILYFMDYFVMAVMISFVLGVMYSYGTAPLCAAGDLEIFG